MKERCDNMKETKPHFLITFFKSSTDLEKGYLNRHYLNWTGILFLFIFLNALSVIPVTLHYAKISRYPIERLYEEAFQVLQEGEELSKEIHIHKGKLLANEVVEKSYPSGVFGIHPAESLSESEIDSDKPGFRFEKYGFTLFSSAYPAFFVPYSNVELKKGTTGKEIQIWAGKEWTKRNRPLLVGFFSLLIGIILFMSLMFLSLLSSFLLYVTGRQARPPFKSVKEALHVTLHGLFLPTAFASMFSLFSYDPVISWLMQSGGMCIMLLLMVAKALKVRKGTPFKPYSINE